MICNPGNSKLSKVLCGNCLVILHCALIFSNCIYNGTSKDDGNPEDDGSNENYHQSDTTDEVSSPNISSDEQKSTSTVNRVSHNESSDQSGANPDIDVARDSSQINSNESLSNVSPEWTSRRLSTAIVGTGAALVGTKVYIMGALGHPATTEVYDTISDTWSIEPSIGQRYWVSAASNGTTTIFAGGYSADGPGPSSIVDIFDWHSGLWTRSNMPSPGERLTSASMDKFLFFSNAYSAYAFNSTSGAWTSYSLSVPRKSTGVASGSMAFFAGGFTSGAVCTTAVDIFDVATGARNISYLSSARADIGAISSANKVYFAGGGCVGLESYFDTIDIFDTTDSTWSMAKLSQPRSCVSAAKLGRRLIFAGGYTWSGLSDRVDIFDTVSGSWTQTKISEPRACAAAVAFGNGVLFVGGMIKDGHSNAVDIYRPPD